MEIRSSLSDAGVLHCDSQTPAAGLRSICLSVKRLKAFVSNPLLLACNNESLVLEFGNEFRCPRADLPGFAAFQGSQLAPVAPLRRGCDRRPSERVATRRTPAATRQTSRSLVLDPDEGQPRTRWREPATACEARVRITKSNTLEASCVARSTPRRRAARAPKKSASHLRRNRVDRRSIHAAFIFVALLTSAGRRRKCCRSQCRGSLKTRCASRRRESRDPDAH